MATVKDFEKIGTIEGVSSYVLVRNDGFVVSENYEDAISLTSAIVTSGKYCDSLNDDLDYGRYTYCCIERSSGQNILVFSLGRYYLGIIKHADTEPQLLSSSVKAFIKSLSS
jgi:predicted regulator of Ras-like GTPase activity (Roadblock/LC7/MglB family)